MLRHPSPSRFGTVDRIFPALLGISGSGQKTRHGQKKNSLEQDTNKRKTLNVDGGAQWARRCFGYLNREWAISPTSVRKPV